MASEIVKQLVEIVASQQKEIARLTDLCIVGHQAEIGVEQATQPETYKPLTNRTNVRDVLNKLELLHKVKHPEQTAEYWKAQAEKEHEKLAEEKDILQSEETSALH